MECEAGRKEGRKDVVIELIKIKFAKGSMIAEIADALEKDEDTIESLIQQYISTPL